jgi:MFS family permease
VHRLLVYVCAVIMVEIMLGSAIAPLLPELQDELGLAKWEAGALVAAYALGVVLFSIPAAILTSRLGPRRGVVIGLLMLGVSSLAFGVFDNVWLLDLSRLLQGAAAAMSWTAALAWLVAATPLERRGEFIGITIGVGLVGALLGPVIGGAAATFGREITFGACAALMVALTVIAFLLEVPPRFVEQPVRLLFRVARDRTVALGLWLVALPGLLFGTVLVLGPLRLEEAGWGVLGVTVTFVVAAAGEAMTSPIAGRFSDRLGRTPVLRTGLAAAAGASIALPLVDARWVTAGVIVAAAMSYSLFWSPAIALIMDRSERLGLGTTMSLGLVNLAFAPGALVGSVLAGALGEAFGDLIPFVLVAALALATLPLLGWLRADVDGALPGASGGAEPSPAAAE